MQSKLEAANWATDHLHFGYTDEDLKALRKGARDSSSPTDDGTYFCTAVSRVLGWPDDCPELELMRGFRDGYCQQTRERQRMVALYHRIAPTIVRRIDQQPEARELWLDAWRRHVQPILAAAQAGDLDHGYALYTAMVRELADRWLSPDERAAMIGGRGSMAAVTATFP